VAGTFPTLAAGQIAQHPITRKRSFGVRVLQFGNDTEQRFVRHAPLSEWNLTYRDLKAADVATLRTFFDSQKGQFDKSWDITIAGVSYQNMTFLQDDFPPVETKGTRHSLTLRARQVRKN